MSRPARGMTLIEMMVAVGITSIVVALAISVVTTGVKVARQGEQTVHGNEAARGGMEMLLRDLRLAGLPGGVWVTSVAGPPFRINPIFTAAGTGGTDDLWMVVPRPNSLQGNCSSPGSGAVITAAGSGALTVNCTAPFATTDTLLVSNFNAGALIDGLAFPSATSITYAQQGVAGFSASPQKGGYQRGDQVFVVDLIRYHVRPDPMTNRPVLVRQVGALAATPTAAIPFEVPAGSPEKTYADVEDLQVAFGTGLAPALTFASGHAPAYSANAFPIAVRVSVVGVSHRPILDDHGLPMPYAPVTLEDHVPSPAVDGYRRSVYRRRVDLLNMNPVNL